MKEKKYDWLFVESGTTSNGSNVQILPNLTVKEISKFIISYVKEVKKKKPNLYQFGSETLSELIIRKNPDDNEIDSVYGYAMTSENFDFEAHVLDRIYVNYLDDKDK